MCPNVHGMISFILSKEINDLFRRDWARLFGLPHTLTGVLLMRLPLLTAPHTGKFSQAGCPALRVEAFFRQAGFESVVTSSFVGVASVIATVKVTTTSVQLFAKLHVVTCAEATGRCYFIIRITL